MVEKIQFVEFTNQTEYQEEPSSRKSSNLLGERLSKEARTQLGLLCLKGLREENEGGEKLERGRGRPRCVEALLAERVGVTTRAVRNWLCDDPGRACDVNADALAKIAYGCYPEETAILIRGDAEAYLNLVDLWLHDRESEYREEGSSRKSVRR